MSENELDKMVAGKRADNGSSKDVNNSEAQGAVANFNEEAASPEEATPSLPVGDFQDGLEDGLDDDSDAEPKKSFISGIAQKFKKTSKASEDDPEDDEEPSGFTHKKKLIAASVTVAVLAGISGGAYLFMESQKPSFITQNQIRNDKVEDTQSSLTDDSSNVGGALEPASTSIITPQAIPEIMENEYLRKIDDLSMKFSILTGEQNRMANQITSVSNQLEQLSLSVSLLRNQLASVPEAGELQRIQSSISSTDQKISFVRESVNQLNSSLEKSIERSIQNATKIDMQASNTENELKEIKASLAESDKKLVNLDKQLSTQNYSVSEPTRVQYRDERTSITKVPSPQKQQEQPDNADTGEMKVLTQLTLKDITQKPGSETKLLVQDEQNNTYELPMNYDFGSQYGYITELVNGSYGSEPFVRTSTNYIITTNAGKERKL